MYLSSNEFMTGENDGAERDAADLMPGRLTRRNYGARQEIEGQKAGQGGRRRHVRDHECRRVGRRHTAAARPEQPNSQTGSLRLQPATVLIARLLHCCIS
jgi:hypothetical protein